MKPYKAFTRPGAAWAVSQTPLRFITYMTRWSFVKFFSNPFYSQTERGWEGWHSSTWHVSLFPCHVSHVTWPMSHVAALNRRLFKYLTAQYTCGTPTLTKQNRTLARLGSLLYLQPLNTIKVNGFFFFCPLYYWVNW